jgi:Na+/proline symporter
MEQSTGFLLILAYFVAVFFITRMIGRKSSTKLDYLLANRSIPGWMAAFSLAATWVWAPSMFVASEKAFTSGWVGVFWFVVPNVLTLVIFAYFATWMRKKYPDGWTFSDYIRSKYSNRTHNLYLIESFGLQTLSLAVQLLAGATIMWKITGLPFMLTTILLAIIPLIYTFAKGLRASIITDYWQMLWILIVLLLGLPFMFINGGGMETLIEGLSGKAGDIQGMFSGKGLAVTLAFGIPTTIGLLSGTFGDQMFWQRVFAIKQGQVKKAFLWAAVIFACVPISLAVFGFFAAGKGLDIQDTQLVNVGAVIAFAPNWFLYLFMVMILSGLISTVDSIICAVSSVTGHDLYNRIRKLDLISEVEFAKWSMVYVTVLAILIANIPGLKILHLFLIYGTLRASVMLPTAFAIKGIRMSERGLFYGLLTSMVIGLPIFAIGNFSANTVLIVTGSLFTILASGIISITVKDETSKV